MRTKADRRVTLQGGWMGGGGGGPEFGIQCVFIRDSISEISP